MILSRSEYFFVKLEYMHFSDQNKVTKRKIVCYLNSRYKLVGRQSLYAQAGQGAPHVLCPVMLCHSYIHIYTQFYVLVQCLDASISFGARWTCRPRSSTCLWWTSAFGASSYIVVAVACTDQSTTPPSGSVC